MSPCFQELLLRNFLSFGPEAASIKLQNLNIIIGPNGSGKSNLIEAFELLRAAPTDISVPFRAGGGAQEWVWKGSGDVTAALDLLCKAGRIEPLLHYGLEFAPVAQGFEVIDEVIENDDPIPPGKSDLFFYYRYQGGNPAVMARDPSKSAVDDKKIKRVPRKLNRDEVKSNQSILSQRKDPEIYPEITTVGETFGSIQIFREWQFGRSALLRRPQPADAPSTDLLPDLSNLGLVINDLEHRSGIWPRFNDYCRRFLPRFSHLSTRVQSGSVQIYIHENGLSSPVPATRLSDGTIRFLALLAILLAPDQHRLICIDEPELGIHPDALAIIAELLTEASSHSQLIVTTQSDVLVSAFSDQPEAVLVCEHRPGSGTFLNRLEPEKLAFWLEKYRLGEIWRIGELGGNP